MLSKYIPIAMKAITTTTKDVTLSVVMRRRNVFIRHITIQTKIGKKTLHDNGNDGDGDHDNGGGNDDITYKYSYPSRVQIVEVGPRDGLQNEAQFVPTHVKLELIKLLVGNTMM